ncbi:YdbC family protein [Treponema pectinovorum]|uniref:YdbC family protein n=1 Tax=Treponema pectinovorum TaxID=164 RepID=UPI0011C80B8B|nr:YdbC family protein [Treponema pectinovorum]
MADDFSYEITEKLGVFSTSKSGWTTELNKVSWGGRPEKYDIRPWAPDHQKMGKGISLTAQEVIALKELLNKIEIK